MDFTDLGKNPISDANPAGEDVRFEPDFESLETEIGKLSSPTASGGIDWAAVVKLSHDILAQKSKNLNVATYLCVGLLQTEGLKGFASGVHVLREVLENYWDTLFPPKKRMRGRINAVTWWSERVDAKIADMGNETWPKEQSDSFADDLAGIDTFLGENVDDAPILRPLSDRITSLIEVEPEKETEPPPADEPPAGTGESEEKAPSQAPAPAQAPPVSPDASGVDVDAEKLLKQGLDILGKAATSYMKKEPLSVVPFRINRIAAWLLVQNVPPATGGKTLIPPPEEHIISSFNSLYQSQNWRDLLLSAEARVRQYLFWIDLSRYVAEALEQLRYPAISEAVAQETAGFVNRMTGLEKLAFSDGTPFADEETKDWLKSFAQTQGGAGASSSSGGGSNIGQLVEHELSEAQKLMKENKLSAALNGFMLKVNQSSSLRERFCWKTGLCHLLLRAKQPQLVLPYIQDILNMTEAYKIEEWEPELAINGLSMALSALRLQGEKKDDELIEQVLSRISVLNPTIALELL